jgi:hemoglobin/transferrin/lactoferrin receptor protein
VKTRTAILTAALVVLTIPLGRPLLAGGQFEARVVDKVTGHPIANAEVNILNYPGQRITGPDGRITWHPAPPPPFEVLVILPGGRYMKPVLVEKLPEAGPLDIAVETLVSEAVTVQAGAAPSIETTPANGTTLVTLDDMMTRAPVNLTQSLENVAGVASVSEGHAAVPAVRGLAGGRTVILIDGARVTAERRVGPSATFLDPFSLDSVEVSRGPGSVAYGSDAFGGVIAAKTRRVAPNAPLGFRFIGSLGTGTPEARGGFEVAKGLDKGSVLFQAHVRNFDDYRSPDGDVFNSGAEDSGFLARGEYQVGPGTLSAAWQSDFGRDIERPRNNSTTVRFYYPTEDSHRLNLDYEMGHFGGLDRLTFSGFLGTSAVVTDQDRFATATTARSIERADVSANDFQFRALGERSVNNARVEFGVDVNGRYDLEAIEERVAFTLAGDHLRTDSFNSIENAHKTDTGAFASVQLPFSQSVMLTGGIRGDYVTTENTGGFFGDRSSSTGAASGFGAATVAISRFSLTGQVSRGFRDPVLSDRYFRGPSGRGFITGNPDLEPETSLQYDGAIRYTAANWRAGFFVFHYRIDDLIERYQTDPDFFFFRNRGRARIRGVELETQGKLGWGLTMELAAQITRGDALDDDIYLDTIPPPSISAQFRKQILSKGFAQLRVAAYDRDDRPGPTERVIPGYGLLDLSGGWRLSNNLDVRVLGRNLLDKQYFISADTRTVLAPGASFVLTILARF